MEGEQGLAGHEAQAFGGWNVRVDAGWQRAALDLDPIGNWGRSSSFWLASECRSS
jgi:hypothetical protein